MEAVFSAEPAALCRAGNSCQLMFCMNNAIVKKSDMRSVGLTLQFEEGISFSPGFLEDMAKSGQRLGKLCPVACSSLPFFDSSKVADWLTGRLGAGYSRSHWAFSGKAMRLKTVKFGSEVLLENHYRPDGRLGKCVYADGEIVERIWDDTSRVVIVRCRSGCATQFKFRFDDLVESVIYDGCQRFLFDYDNNDRPSKLSYPDGICSLLGYGQHGELVTTTVGGVRTDIHWTSEGLFSGWSIQSSSGKYELKESSKKIDCSFSIAPPDPGSAPASPSSTVVDHLLGRWRMSPSGGLEEMLAPWGARYRVHFDNQGRPNAVWSPCGRHAFAYGSGGALSAITHPDGSRSMIFPLEDQRKAVLVHPGSVALLEYEQEQNGRLRKWRDGSGAYCLYEYARSGAACRVEQFQEVVKLSHDRTGRLALVSFDNGCRCTLSHSSEGALLGLGLSGVVMDRLSKIHGLIGFLWQWLAVRPTLRLEWGLPVMKKGI